MLLFKKGTKRYVKVLPLILKKFELENLSVSSVILQTISTASKPAFSENSIYILLIIARSFTDLFKYNWRKAEAWLILWRLRWTILPKVRYSEWLSGRTWNTQPSIREADALPLSSSCPNLMFCHCNHVVQKICKCNLHLNIMKVSNAYFWNVRVSGFAFLVIESQLFVILFRLHFLSYEQLFACCLAHCE